MNRKNVGILLLAGLASACTSNNNHPATAIQHDSADDVHPDAPITANTHFAAGQVAESQGDIPRAIAQYRESAKLDSKAAAPLLRLGMIYTNLKQFDDAVGMWKRYIAATGGAAAGYCDLGYTLEISQQFPAAEEAYKSAIAKEPKNETARVDYGLMLARLGRLDEATMQLQVVLTPAEAHYNLASVLESEGKVEGAKREYQEAIRLDPDMNDARVRLLALE